MLIQLKVGDALTDTCLRADLHGTSLHSSWGCQSLYTRTSTVSTLLTNYWRQQAIDAPLARNFGRLNVFLLLACQLLPPCHRHASVISIFKVKFLSTLKFHISQRWDFACGISKGFWKWAVVNLMTALYSCGSLEWSSLIVSDVPKFFLFIQSHNHVSRSFFCSFFPLSLYSLQDYYWIFFCSSWVHISNSSWHKSQIHWFAGSNILLQAIC